MNYDAETIFVTALNGALIITAVYMLVWVFRGGKKKSDKTTAKTPPATAETTAAQTVKTIVKQAEKPAAVAATDDGDEIASVIAAAVAAMSSDYVVTGIKAAFAGGNRRRTAWGRAGIAEVTV